MDSSKVVAVNRYGCWKVLGLGLALLASFALVYQLAPHSRHLVYGTVEFCGASGCDTCENPAVIVSVTRQVPTDRFVRVKVAFAQPSPDSPDAKSGLDVSIDLQGVAPGGDRVPVASNASFARTVTCTDARQGQCESINLLYLDLVRYPDYMLTIGIAPAFARASCVDRADGSAVLAHVAMEYASPRFGLFEVIFQYTLMAITVVVLAHFYRRLRDSSSRHMVCEQRWVCGLLAGLLVFNEPLAGVQFVSWSASLHVLHASLGAAFVSTAFFFCLLLPGRIVARASARQHENGRTGTFVSQCKVASDAPAGLAKRHAALHRHKNQTQQMQQQRMQQRQPERPALHIDTSWREPSERRPSAQGAATCQHAGKGALCATIWASIAASEAFLALQQHSDPSLDPAADLVPVASLHAGLVTVVIVVYVLWLGRLAAKDLVLLDFVLAEDAFLLGINTSMLVMLCGGVAAGSFRLVPGSSDEGSVLLLGLFSSYVWVLAVALSPAATEQAPQHRSLCVEEMLGPEGPGPDTSSESSQSAADLPCRV